MPQEIIVSTSDQPDLAERLQTALTRTRPSVVGLASAFVSVWGVERIIEMLGRCGSPACRFIAGTSNYITHPESLYLAREKGWSLRLGQSATGIFHPKILIAGSAFGNGGTIEPVTFIYVGSANLTRRGLTKNTECGIVAEADATFAGAASSFAHLWNTAIVADDAALRNYAATFAEINRRRPPVDLEALDVSEKTMVAPPETAQILATKPPKRSAVKNEFAESAWTGLQSFTGDYAFQVEFPKSAGAVVSRLALRRATAGGRLDVLCTNDNQTRNMQFRFYQDNGMFRLNIPNEVPNVQWVRDHRDGLALIQRGPTGGAPIRLTIHLPGTEANEIIDRSLALGSWGKTSMRLYGWF
jgi:HKD family nuclease